MVGVGIVTPGEEFSCDNDLADRLVKEGRATLVNDNGRTSDAETASTADVVTAPDTKSEAPAVTPKKSKVTLEAEIAADSAALAAAESEGLVTPAPESA